MADGNVLVCELPGCGVTQKDVETALGEYLDGFCVKCGKKRDGSLCGCPFPCSLTFKGQMLDKIYQLVGKEVPTEAKSIQVCFKHPELLRLARDASLACKPSKVEHMDLEKDTIKGLRTVKITDDCSVVNLGNSLLTQSKLRVDLPEDFSILSDVQDHREFLQQIERPGDILEQRDVSDSMTGLVFTDERGQEQGVLGKLVYTTDETGSRNIILQELGEEGGVGKSGRLMKIQLGDMPGFAIDPAEINTGGGGASLQGHQEDPLALRRGGGLMVEEETRKLLEPATNSIILQHGISRRKLVTPVKRSANGAPRTVTISRKAAVTKTWSSGLGDCVLLDRPANSGQEVAVAVQGVEDRRGQVEEHPGLAAEEPELEVARGNKFSNSLKIHYKDFEHKLMKCELPGLSSHQQLCDVLLVCRDGEMFSSGLFLASISGFLKDLLNSVPRIDQHRTIILPDFFNLSNISLLNRIIFQDIILDDLSLEELDNLTTLAQTLQCTQLTEFCESRMLVLTTAMRLDLPESPAGSGAEEVEPPDSLEHSIVFVDRDSESSPMKRLSRGPLKKKKKKSFQPLVGLKIDKSQLNNDYLDAAGIVRLDSRDEMALHYCIICDAKFKKYKQAMTHYKTFHLLEAMLACDVCDTLFKDIFNCVKHKHEQHGGFDRNLQCYVCEEVFYSRFRLSTHFKENHKNLFGDYICKTCGMKFPAEHYLESHTADQHAEQSNSCNICGKTFSGKRYLTMHIKSAHQLGGKFDFQCKYCAQSFSSRKEMAFHAVKTHKEEKPVGMFEECDFCDKFFKTKTELKQHTSRKHKDILL